MSPFLSKILVGAILPLAIWWVKRGEQQALKNGRGLTKTEKAHAQSIEISDSERIRVLEVDSIFPFERGNFTRGVCYRYGILVRRGCREPELVAHELVHTLQYERLGGIKPFLRAYLLECFIDKYPNGDLEQEAIIETAKYFG